MLTTAPPYWFWFVLSVALLSAVSPLLMGAIETLLRVVQTVQQAIQAARSLPGGKRFF